MDKPIGINELKFDCRHFKGGIPCKPNKLHNKICNNCDEYDKIETRILIIKLGALGDVIRTTPLIERFRKEYKGVHITWITLSPDILPKSEIDEIYPFDFQSTYIIRHQQYDIAINLDKEYEACALLQDVKAHKKMGFILKDHHIDIANENAEHKLITGLFDGISQANTRNYLEEIFEICEFEFHGEEYVLDVNEAFALKWKNEFEFAAKGKKIIGLNTGCGKRWLTRLWPQQYWLQLIESLKQKGYYPVVLGGPDEDEMNKFYAAETGAYYPGTHSLKEFIAIASQCDVIVSAVSMMMHIAIGVKKPLVLFNNIFNRHEFLLYNRGQIVEPESGCDCYYGNTCTRTQHCMESLKVSTVLQAIEDSI
ncbi:glycosyltransferase family 9 protein [bacterium]|nr:glycosyltransferase family 9 protein [bacterium]